LEQLDLADIIDESLDARRVWYRGATGMNGTIARGLLCAAVLLSIPAFAVSGQSVWEGSAAVSRYGELPSTGYFGASNTFPLNSLVTVTESAGGRSVTVFIISTLSEPGIFLLLSPQAAQELGVEKGALVPVKAAATRPGAQTAGPVSIPEPEGPDLDSPPARGSSGAAAVAPKKEGKALLDEILEELRASSRRQCASNRPDLLRNWRSSFLPPRVRSCRP
jgi:hypothetical protein